MRSCLLQARLSVDLHVQGFRWGGQRCVLSCCRCCCAAGAAAISVSPSLRHSDRPPGDGSM